MFRAIVLSFVLVFAAGPSVSLFCKAWCDPSTAAENGCHHEGSSASASVAASHSCQDSVQEPAIVLKEDVRRTSLLDSGLNVEMARFQLAAQVAGNRPVWHRGRTPYDVHRPLNIPLRV